MSVIVSAERVETKPKDEQPVKDETPQKAPKSRKKAEE